MESTQQEMYECVQPTIDAAIQGYNATVLTYGQTGSGKTFTLCGTSEEAGIIPRSFRRLADALQRHSSAMTVRMSMVEIYCERVRDLLAADGGQPDLAVQRDSVRGFHVAGAVEAAVTTAEEMGAAFQSGLANRAVRGTGMNAESSRSHLLVSLYISCTQPDGAVARSKLCLVDLAGSERQSKTRADGASLTEGCAINRSLSALGNVVAALGEGAKAAHVPFRDSKLTRLLQDCLAGNSLMLLIICLSPDAEQLQETVSTLRFGSRALGITNVVRVNKAVPYEQLLRDRDGFLLRVKQLEAVVQKLKGECAVDVDGHASVPAATDSLSGARCRQAATLAGGPAAVAVDFALLVTLMVQFGCLVLYFVPWD